MKRRGAFLGWLAAFGLFAMPGHAVPPRDGSPHAERATDLTTTMDYDEARRELAAADGNDAAVVLAKARLALFEEKCDLAAATLSQVPLVSDEARLIAEVARGCARVIASTYIEHDVANGVFLRYQDDADRALSPLLVDTANRAREALRRDVGMDWRAPLRITVVRDTLSLSAMTGLPYSSAQTTGTIAVAKWGRVTMLSPRASVHGFAFRDTLAHELTHLAVAVVSHDRAPLWLHEGLARREESRWREPSPFDDRPSPESIVLQGMAMKLTLPLDQLGPSIAMLPSAEAAFVAFAEVTSFVSMLARTSTPDAIPRLLVALETAETVDGALVDATGATLAQWDARWRAELVKVNESSGASSGLGLGAMPGLHSSRERVRLAELLLGRGHPAQALDSLKTLSHEMLADPGVRSVKARALEASGRADAAMNLLKDPSEWASSYGPCWALRGKLARSWSADEADRSFAQAWAYDPLAVETSCQANAAAESALGPEREKAGAALCDAARARGEPEVGRE